MTIQLIVQFIISIWCGASRYEHFEAFLEQTLSNLQNKTIGLLRADTGFYSKKIFELLEKRDTPISYIIGCPMYVTIQRTIESQKVWMQLEEGIEIAQTYYQSPAWDKSRRLILVRQKIAARPKATGKVLSLFEDDEIINGYRHRCYITNLSLPPAEIWRCSRNGAT